MILNGFRLPRLSLTKNIIKSVKTSIIPTLSNFGYNSLTSKFQSIRAIPSLYDILSDIILRAVPKKKTTHSKKRMRSAGKGNVNRTDIVRCPGCGRVKLMGHLCLHCYKDIKRRLKNALFKE
ncbi:putative 54S ribosomal protein L32, mitochondrial [Smittium culicis]|uniref:Large ribosomal subunit protein bL32m n=1 Tax=Smittium culicis TaxID=133412 RepID=A0A1R1XEW2_9FUNG|nr:putative 54S ribosomal protein L32, mitochondrial [Smittium culicis]